MGRTNRLSYRVVVAQTRTHQSGKIVEFLGFFDPYNPEKTSINTERLSYWKKTGAAVAESVKKLIDKKYQFKVYQPKKKAVGS
jgi:small subunit ribosomal protein S16